MDFFFRVQKLLFVRETFIVFRLSLRIVGTSGNNGGFSFTFFFET